MNLKEHLHMKVAEAICAYIREEGLRPGDRLPPERAMAARFSAGRNTVREAIRALRDEGVIEVVQGRGAYVKRALMDEGEIRLKLMKINYRDLLEIKMWLEQLAIRRAAHLATDEQLLELTRRAQALEVMREGGKFSKEMDRLFHIQLLQCGGNGTLSQLVLTLIDELNRYSQLIDGDDVWLSTIPYHLDIARGLTERNLALPLAAHEYIHQFDVRVLDSLGARRTEDE